MKRAGNHDQFPFYLYCLCHGVFASGFVSLSDPIEAICDCIWVELFELLAQFDGRQADGIFIERRRRYLNHASVSRLEKFT